MDFIISPPSVSLFDKYGSLLDILKNMILGVTYQTDITMYPGVEVDIPDKPPFGCRDATFKLTWDKSDIHLGFSIVRKKHPVTKYEEFLAGLSGSRRKIKVKLGVPLTPAFSLALICLLIF